MNSSLNQPRPNHLLNVTLFVALCCLVKYVFDDFVNMLLISVVFAIVLRPMINFLVHRLRFPFFLSLITIFAVFLSVLTLIVLIVNSTINQFIANFETTAQQFVSKINSLHTFTQPLLDRLGIEFTDRNSITSFITSKIDPSIVAELMKKVWYSVTGFMSGSVIVILTLVFILIDIDFWQYRLNTVLEDRPKSIQNVYSMFNAVATYINKKFLISCLTSFTVLVICIIFNVQFGFMWAILTFGFNFIPNVGVFIVSAPMILQAFMLNTLGQAFGFTAAIVVVHFVTGNVIEPRYMSKHLNLSNTIVWLSVLFWAIILGPIGMLMAIPLTTTIRILLSMSPHYQKLAIMMEGEPIRYKDAEEAVSAHKVVREQALALLADKKADKKAEKEKRRD
ncbi:hypothetical protein CKF54_06120 [Psittacicella hinzii]|uniref:AI-2E family transporter n=1 Tax=Psittacicella hinzii TaxID=2028575 RepID=A0A3A1Y380_9GAMM|nr:AI-2E family transporter [Psittacicella hinzii]RIY31759.1 hypothetical protein CKF54_06120 [Psittacicella hinzii]